MTKDRRGAATAGEQRVRRFHLAALLVFACSLLLVLQKPANASIWSLLHLGDEATFNIRFEVVLDIDGQKVTASAVHEISASTEIRTLPGTGGGLSVTGRGEALKVEIPGKPAFYFLVADRGGNEGWYGAIIEDCGLNDDTRDPVSRLQKFRSFTGPCELGERSIPLVVRLSGGGSDTSSVEVVTLPEHRGPNGDVRLVSATIERTNDDVSNAILNQLPWLASTPTINIATPKGHARISASLFFRR